MRKWILAITKYTVPVRWAHRRRIASTPHFTRPSELCANPTLPIGRVVFSKIARYNNSFDNPGSTVQDRRQQGTRTQSITAETTNS